MRLRGGDKRPGLSCLGIKVYFNRLARFQSAPFPVTRDGKPCSAIGVSKISISPPQDRPTVQAVSSATPKCRRVPVPLSRLARPASITAPSIHPPDTEPAISIWLSITNSAPVWRGAEPQVRITNASTTWRPASHQSLANINRSRSVSWSWADRCGWGMIGISFLAVIGFHPGVPAFIRQVSITEITPLKRAGSDKNTALPLYKNSF